MSYYSRVKKDLAAAAAKNIITAGQETALLNHFKENRGFFARLTLSHWLGAAGGLFSAIGIILIIAFNWDHLGSFIKIFAFLLMLGGTGYAFSKTEERPALHTALGIIWFFLPAAGIGLLAQIFQLSGTPVQPYFTWAALSAPLAIWGKGKIYSRMMSVLLLFILFYGTFEDTSVFFLMFDNSAAVSAVAAHWTAALALLAAAVGINFYKKDSFSPAVAAALSWTVIMMCADNSAFYAGSAELCMSALIAAAVLLSLYKMKFSAGGGLPVSSFINNGTRIWIFLLYILSFMHGNSSSREMFRGISAAGTYIGIAAALAMISAAAWLAAKARIMPENKNGETAVKLLLIASMAIPFLPAMAGSKYMNTAGIAANILLIAAGAALLHAGSFYGSRKALHHGMGIISLIAVTRFLDLFASQLTSGMAFLATGGIFAFMAWWFSRGAAQIAGNANCNILNTDNDKAGMASTEAEHE